MEDLVVFKETPPTELGPTKEPKEFDSNEPRSEGKDSGTGISDSESNRDSLNLDDFEKVDADQLHQQMVHPNQPLPIPETHPGSEIVTDLLGSDSSDQLLDFSLSYKGTEEPISHAPSLGFTLPGGANLGAALPDLGLVGPPSSQQGAPSKVSLGDDPLILETKNSSPIGFAATVSEMAYSLKGATSTEPNNLIEELTTRVPHPISKETQLSNEPTSSSLKEPISSQGDSLPPREPTPPSNDFTPPTKVPTLPLIEPVLPLKEQTPPPREPTPPLKEPTQPPREPTPTPKDPTAPQKQPTPPPKEATLPPNEPTSPPKEPTLPPKAPLPPPKELTPHPKEPTLPPKEPTPPPKEPTPPPKQPTPPPREPTPPPKEPSPAPKAPSLPAREPTPPQKELTHPLREPISPVTEKVVGSTFVSSVKSSFPTVGFTSDAPIKMPLQGSSISAGKDSKLCRSDLSSDIALAVKRSLGILQPYAWFKPDQLDPRVVNLIYWRDVKKSGIVFGSIMIILLSLAYLSLISVVAYVSLGVLTCNIAFRIYKNIMQAVQKSQDGHPFKDYLEMETNLQSDKVHEATDVIIAQVNSTVTALKSLFFVQDLIDSIKFGCLLWCLTYLGAWFNGLTLVILFVVALFTLPKVYEQYQAQIDQYIELVMTQVNDVMTKVKAALPIGSKEKSQ